jgi:hypothetical protein
MVTSLVFAAVAHPQRSVNASAFLAFSLAWLVVTGCSRSGSKELVGTWRTDVIESEWGSNRITVCYRPNGHFWQSNDFSGGGMLGRQGTYHVRGKTLVRTLQGSTRTEEIAFSVSGNKMHQNLGAEEYNFTRVGTEPSRGTE